jgi:alpha-L-rhamnosidase
VEFLRRQSPDLIRSHPDRESWGGFGDWLAHDGGDNWAGRTPKDLIGTAYFAYSTRLLAEIAGVLGHKDDAAQYERLFVRIRRAFQKRFVTRAGFVAGGTQTGYVLALRFDLLPEKARPVAVRELVRDIEKRGNRLATGFVGTAALPYVLSDNGRLDVAYRLLLQRQWPSWLYAVTQGATTIWERWDGWTHDKGFQDVAMNSFNHYAYGAIGEWLYARVAGLEIGAPGYKQIRIAPQPGGGLRHARARLQTMYGVAESAWRIAGGKFRLAVTIPANTTATVQLPGEKKVRRIGAGRYQFEVRYGD